MAASRKSASSPPSIHVNPWADFINPEIEEVDKIVEKYGFHPLDRDAILEENQYARIDTYDEYMFMVLHFPKYDTSNERYVSNEFNIFIAPTYLLTFRYYQTGTVKKLQDKYDDWDGKTPYPSSGFLLYEVIENLLEHVMKMLERFHKDLKMIEKTLFTANGPDLIREIMVKETKYYYPQAYDFSANRCDETHADTDREYVLRRNRNLLRKPRR
jgi:magnesium transporter